MAVLGGVLGAALLCALIALTVLVYRHYGRRLICSSGRVLVRLWAKGQELEGQERGVPGRDWRRQRAAGDGGVVERGRMESGQREAGVSVGDGAQRRGEQGGGAECPSPSVGGQGGQAQLVAG